MNEQASGKRSNDVSSFRAELGQQWRAFLLALGHPVTLLLLVGTAILVALSITHHGTSSTTSSLGTAVFGLLTVSIAVLSGIVGSNISRRLESLSETTRLVTRGRSAIRGLNLLIGNLDDARLRAEKFHEDADDFENQSLVQQWLEELGHSLQGMQLEAINAIQEWQDIIPEADVPSQLAKVQELEIVRQGLVEQVGSLKEELEAEKSKSAKKDQKAKDLQRQLTDRLSSLSRVQANLSQAASSLPTVSTSATQINLASIFPHSGIRGTVAILAQEMAKPAGKCENCGAPLTGGDVFFNRCPKCGHPIKDRTPPEK